MNERGRVRAIACLHAYEHVGDGRLQPNECYALTRQATGRLDETPFDQGVRQLAFGRFCYLPDTVGKLQHDG
jgi:hypothetical protein